MPAGARSKNDLFRKKIGVSREEFEEALRLPAKLLRDVLRVQKKIVRKKSPMEILKGVRISARGDEVRLTAFDMETAVIAEIRLLQEFKGTLDLVVTLDELLEVISRIEGDVLLMKEPDRNNLLLSDQSKGLVVKFATYLAEEFPAVESDLRHAFAVGVSPVQLNRALRRVMFASSYPDESNPVYASVLFEVDKELENDLVMVATDGSQLAREEISVQEFEVSDKELLEELKQREESEYLRFLVPVRGLTTLLELLPKKESKEEDQVKLLFSGTSFGVAYVDRYADRDVSEGYEVRYRLISRQVEGEFPAYREVIPSVDDYDLIFKVRRKELLRQLQLIRPFTKTKELEGIITFEMDEKLYLYSLDGERGTAVLEVPAEVIKGTRGKQFYQNKMLVVAINAMDGFEEIRIHASFDEESYLPMMITTEESPGYLYLLMPVRIQMVE